MFPQSAVLQLCHYGKNHFHTIVSSPYPYKIARYFFTGLIILIEASGMNTRIHEKVFTWRMYMDVFQGTVYPEIIDAIPMVTSNVNIWKQELYTYLQIQNKFAFMNQHIQIKI